MTRCRDELDSFVRMEWNRQAAGRYDMIGESYARPFCSSELIDDDDDDDDDDDAY